MHKFKELKVWQNSRILCKSIYELTKSFPDIEKFGLTNQIRRSVISIPSNIAEGSGRNSNKDFCKFLNYAISSSFELETQLIIASDLNYLNEFELEEILKELEIIQKMIHKLSTYYKNN